MLGGLPRRHVRTRLVKKAVCGTASAYPMKAYVHQACRGSQERAGQERRTHQRKLDIADLRDGQRRLCGSAKECESSTRRGRGRSNLVAP